MKNKIKNAFKKASIASIAFIAGLVVFVGGLSVYANWMDTKVETDPIDATDWNDMSIQVQGWRRVSPAADSNMFLNTTGNVGIGTTTPTVKLHVNGNIIAADPTEDNHLATKAYVDAAGGGGTAKYYKTATTYDGATASTACDAGYHMCKPDEIVGRSHDASKGSDNLLVPYDSWVNYSSNDGNNQESGDCFNWTSNLSGDYGRVIRLKSGGWEYHYLDCDELIPVMCCSD